MSSELKPARKRGRPRKHPVPASRPSSWQDRLVLNHGESVRLTKRITTGNLLQDDVEHYDVVDAQGQVVGAVVHEANTSLWPPCITHHWLVQTGRNGKVIVEEWW